MGLIKLIRAQWDRALGLALIIAGAVALILGWIGASGATYPAQQIPYLLSGGIGGLFLLGAGATFWLSADLRDEWRNIDRLERRIERRLGESIPKQQAAPDGKRSSNEELLVP